MKTTTFPHWSIDDGRLMFSACVGQTIYPTAQEVWTSVFVVSATPSYPSPADALPHLSFSRFPAEVVLMLSGNLLDGVNAELVIEAGKTLVPFRLTDERSADQIIVEGCWYPLECEQIDASLALLRDQGVSVGTGITLALQIWLKTTSDLPFKVVDRTDACPSATGHLAAAGEAPIEGLNAELYPYQRDGVSFLKLIAKQNLGCIVGDEMGLGKTLQVIALVQSEKNKGLTPSLVIMPATLLENWRRELATFAPTLAVLVHSGARRPGAAEKLTAFDVVITSYETAVRDEPLLSSIEWNVLILDEAQNIKNPDALRTRSVKRLPRRISIAVTGTPVENRLSDLWSLSDFSLPGLLGEITSFQSEFDDTATDASRLAPVVAPILLRRRISEVAKDLPERIDIPQCVSMTRLMAEQYELVRKQAEVEYGAAAGLVALQRLRMFCTHPRLLNMLEGDPESITPKYQRLLEVCDELYLKGEKTLIFSSFTKMADIIMCDFPVRFQQCFVAWIDGRVPISERQIIVDKFSDYQGPGALVLNPKAAGVGLNISAANHVIHYNPEWNPAVVDQATARAYRRKQTRPVTVHYLYFADTVEQVMIERLNFKRTLADGAVTGHKGDATAADVARALRISPIATAENLE